MFQETKQKQNKKRHRAVAVRGNHGPSSMQIVKVASVEEAATFAIHLESL